MKNAYLSSVIKSDILCYALLFTIIAAFSTYCGIQSLSLGINNDLANLIHGSLSLLRGEYLYKDTFRDVNPPLIVLILLPVAILIEWYSVDADFSLYLYTNILVILSFLFLIKAFKDRKIPFEIQTVFLSSYLFSTCILPHCFDVFGDREHFLFIFALPWIILILIRQQPGIYITALATIGFMLKPYNLIFFAALQLFNATEKTPLLKRIFQPTSWVVGILCCTYLVLICIFFTPYITDIMPLAHVAYGYIFSKNIPFETVYILYAFPFFAFPYALSTKDHITYGKDFSVWVFYILAGLVCYMLNGGWEYTSILYLVPLCMFLFALYLPKKTETYTTYYFRFVAFTCLSLILIFSVQSQKNAVLFKIKYGVSSGLTTYLFQQHKDAPVHNILQDDIYPRIGNKFILLSTDAWASRFEPYTSPPNHIFAFDYLWPLPWLYTHQHDPRAPYVMKMITEPLIHSLDQHPDATVLVDISPRHRELPKNINILEFLRKNPKLDDIMRNYKKIQILDLCYSGSPDIIRIGKWYFPCRYEIWKRDIK